MIRDSILSLNMCGMCWDAVVCSQLVTELNGQTLRALALELDPMRTPAAPHRSRNAEEVCHGGQRLQPVAPHHVQERPRLRWEVGRGIGAHWRLREAADEHNISQRDRAGYK